MAISATATKKDIQFIWEGKDKRGHRVRGKALAASEQRAASRLKAPRRGTHARQNPERDEGRWKASTARHRRICPSARDHDVCRHSHGAGLRDHRQWP